MQLPKYLVLDFETRCKFSIKTVTRRQYASDPSTGVLCVGLKWEDTTRVHIPAEGAVFIREQDANRCPEEVLICLEHGIPIVAHNSTFERSIWYYQCHLKLGWPKIPYSLWRDTQPVCLYYGLPRKLEHVCDALNLAHVKDKEGHRLMLQYSAPRRYSSKAVSTWVASGKPESEMPLRWWEDPESLKRIHEYCGCDVEAQDELLKTLGYLPPARQADYDFDERINERGLPIDWCGVHTALGLVNHSMENYDRRLAELTTMPAYPEGMVTSRTQLKQMMQFARLHEVHLDSLDKATIEDTLTRADIPKVVREVLSIRADSGKASLSKLERMLSATDDDGRCRHSMVWHGAATGRKAGQGIQPHNFPSRNCLPEKDADRFHECLADPYYVQRVNEFLKSMDPPIEMPDLLSSALRSFIMAEQGKLLFVSDFSAIETRILAWLSGCPLLYNAFVKGECTYRQFAGRIYGVDPLSIPKKDPMRQVGKVAVLGLGYGMGAEKFYITASGPPNNIDITEAQSSSIVSLYRATYPEVMTFHKECEKAFRQVIDNHGQVQVGRVTFGCNGTWGWIVLPSGRPLWFREPKIVRVRNRWRDDGSTTTEIQYKGVHPQKKTWCTRSTYGGSLVESICQGTTACVMQEAMVRVENGGYPVILTVHDEVVSEADEDRDLDPFHELMKIRPTWAQDLPIDVESQTRKRYGK